MRAICIFSLALLFISCTEERYFEENQDFEDRIWNMEEAVRFEFEIDSLDRPYELKLNLRNTMDYPYRNLYVKYQLLDSTQLLEDKLINLQLFDSKTGKPFGDAQSEIYSHQLLLQDSVYFREKGKYVVKLEQYMRVKELEGIVSTGIRIN